MQIREFDLTRDLGSMLDLWSTAGDGIQLGRSDEPEEIRKKLARDPDLLLVAEDKGRLIGAVMGGFDGRRGTVYHLAVAAGERGKGIGRALMAELERRLQAKGCLKYYLLVTKDNPEAVEFYERQGWEVMDLILMGKVIG
jgi:ribosomal protein S18 acetylase RimI-like enzyme